MKANRQRTTALCLFLFLALVSPAHGEMAIGIKGGAGWALAIGDYRPPNSKSQFQARGAISLFFEWGISSYFSLQPEIFFGFNDGYAYKDSRYTVTTSWDSIGFDLLAKLRIPFKGFAFTIGAGPNIHKSIGEVRMEIRDGSDIYTNSMSFEAAKFTTSSFGITANLSFEFPLILLGFGSVGVRSTWSFSNRSAETGKRITIHQPVTLYLGVGLRF